jgi:hypothetical protein
MQQKVRKILRPADPDGTHFTYAEALAGFREIRKEREQREALAKKKAPRRMKRMSKPR